MKQIKFNEDMLRLVEAGLKTQTRRPVRPHPLGVRETPFTDSGLEDLHGTPIGVEYGFLGEVFEIAGSKYKGKIKSLRVQRLQEISEDDAMAEGVVRVTKDGKVFKYCVYDDGHDNSKTAWSEMPYSPIVTFKKLWNSIYAAKGFGWDENPWVWVIEFEAVKP